MLTIWNFRTMHGLQKGQRSQLQTVPERRWFKLFPLESLSSRSFKSPMMMVIPLTKPLQNHSSPSLPPSVLKDGIYIRTFFPYKCVRFYYCIWTQMAGWKWKPGTVANEKHSISEFDGLLFCYSIWLKFFSKQFIYSETKNHLRFPLLCK